MRVPLTVRDFLDRAELVYGDRVGIIDEPDQPAPSEVEGPAAGWHRVTYWELARRSRAFGAAMDRLGVGPGDRVAIVSHNSARFIAALYGATTAGRILVPINFRLHANEVRYIVEHSGARVLLVDPELEEPLRDVATDHRFVLGPDTDPWLFLSGDMPALVAIDEDDVATLNYTSGTRRGPKA